MCSHQPACPAANRPDREAAHTVASHPEQGWSLLCNGVIVFDDLGELLPDGRAVPAYRPSVRTAAAHTAPVQSAARTGTARTAHAQLAAAAA